MGRRIGAAACVLSAVFVWTAAPAPVSRQAPQREDYNSGAYLYRTFCASCHGEAGRGDGPVADLGERRPSDISALARNNGGTFPHDAVMGVLESLSPLPGHDPPAMPNWRNVLRRTEGDDERIIRQRLEALVSHVASLQKQ